jgi:chromosomal replication initiation ATPase DnaA
MKTTIPTIEEIITTVENVSGHSRDIIFSKNRKKPFTFLRHITFEAINECLGFGVADIGKYFNINHSSILYGRGKIEDAKVMVDEESKQLLAYRTALIKELHNQFGYIYK